MLTRTEICCVLWCSIELTHNDDGMRVITITQPVNCHMAEAPCEHHFDAAFLLLCCHAQPQLVIH